MYKNKERRFLLTQIPGHVNDLRSTTIQRGYFCNKSSCEILIEKRGWKHFQIIHTKKNKKRKTLTIQISRKQFKLLWEGTLDSRIFKTEITTQSTIGSIHIDAYLKDLRGLIIAKVNFPDRHSAQAFSPPDWFGAEITYDKRFYDQALATDSIDLKALPKKSLKSKQSIIIGTIPFFEKDGKIHVVTITTRVKGHIIFPKGQPENKLSADQVALNEAEEEAGINGELVGHPVLVPYKSESNYIAYPMRVRSLKEEWLEKNERTRTVFEINEALNNPACSLIHPSIKILKQILKTDYDQTEGSTPSS